MILLLGWAQATTTPEHGVDRTVTDTVDVATPTTDAVEKPAAASQRVEEDAPTDSLPKLKPLTFSSRAFDATGRDRIEERQPYGAGPVVMEPTADPEIGFTIPATNFPGLYTGGDLQSDPCWLDRQR